MRSVASAFLFLSAVLQKYLDTFFDFTNYFFFKAAGI